MLSQSSKHAKRNSKHDEIWKSKFQSVLRRRKTAKALITKLSWLSEDS